MFAFDKFDGEPTEVQKWEQIRLWRNAELLATDWTQIPDATCDKQAWAEYRQALRDLPTKFPKAENVELPTRPA